MGRERRVSGERGGVSRERGVVSERVSDLGERGELGVSIWSEWGKGGEQVGREGSEWGMSEFGERGEGQGSK